ncbi:MAG: hypothetical protein WDW38_008894 [Sanguina aurantia]
MEQQQQQQEQQQAKDVPPAPPPTFLSCPFNCRSCLQPHTFTPHLLMRHTVELQALAAVLESLTLNCYNQHQCCFSHTGPDGCTAHDADWWRHVREVHLLDALATTLLILAAASAAWLAATTHSMSAAAISARGSSQIAFEQGRGNSRLDAALRDGGGSFHVSGAATSSHTPCPQRNCPSRLPTKLKLLAHMISHVRLNSYATLNADGAMHAYDHSGHSVPRRPLNIEVNAGDGSRSDIGSPASARTPSPNDRNAPGTGDQGWGSVSLGRALQQRPLPSPLQPITAEMYARGQESPGQRRRRAEGVAAAAGSSTGPAKTATCPYPSCGFVCVTATEFEHHAVDSHSEQLTAAAHALSWAARRNKVTNGLVCPLQCLDPHRGLDHTPGRSSANGAGGSGTAGARRQPPPTGNLTPNTPTNSAAQARSGSQPTPAQGAAERFQAVPHAETPPTAPGFHAGATTSAPATHSAHMCGADAPPAGQAASSTGGPRTAEGHPRALEAVPHMAEHAHRWELQQHIQIYHPGPMVVMAGFVAGLCTALGPSEQCPFCSVPTRGQGRGLQYSSCFRGSEQMGKHLFEQHPRKMLQVFNCAQLLSGAAAESRTCPMGCKFSMPIGSSPSSIQFEMMMHAATNHPHQVMRLCNSAAGPVGPAPRMPWTEGAANSFATFKGGPGTQAGASTQGPQRSSSAAKPVSPRGPRSYTSATATATLRPGSARKAEFSDAFTQGGPKTTPQVMHAQMYGMYSLPMHAQMYGMYSLPRPPSSAKVAEAAAKAAEAEAVAVKTALEAAVAAALPAALKAAVAAATEAAAAAAAAAAVTTPGAAARALTAAAAALTAAAAAAPATPHSSTTSSSTPNIRASVSSVNYYTSTWRTSTARPSTATHRHTNDTIATDTSAAHSSSSIATDTSAANNNSPIATDASAANSNSPIATDASAANSNSSIATDTSAANNSSSIATDTSAVAQQ